MLKWHRSRRHLPSFPTRRSSDLQKDADYRAEHERIERSDLEKRSSKTPCDGERREHAERKTDRKSTRLNSSHSQTSYAVFCLKKKKTEEGTVSPAVHGRPVANSG